MHINWTYQTVPGAADLYGGKIEGKLRTYSDCELEVDVEDADLIDGSVTVSLGASAGSPVGFSCGLSFDVFTGDCAEAGASAAWGYSQTGGVAANQTPVNNTLVKASEPEDDPSLKSDLCIYLYSPEPYLSWRESHNYTSDKSYDTTWKTLQNAKDTVLQAEWTGYAGVETKGDKSGAAARAQLNDWDTTAEVKDVRFVP